MVRSMEMGRQNIGTVVFKECVYGIYMHMYIYIYEYDITDLYAYRPHIEEFIAAKLHKHKPSLHCSLTGLILGSLVGMYMQLRVGWGFDKQMQLLQ